MTVDLSDISDARVTPDDVLSGGFQTELSAEQLKPHIATAHGFVQDKLAGELPDVRLARIEVLLVRHSVRMMVDRQVENESIGPVSRTYSGAFDAQELAATAPGQQAMMLDSTDTLGRQTIDFFSCNG